MSDILGLRLSGQDEAALRQEIARRDKIIRALIFQVERGFNSVDSGFALLQNTHALESEVRARTAELKQSVESLEAFIANAPFGVLFSREMHVVRYNRKFGEIFGYRDGEATGRPTRILFRSDEEQQHFGAMASAVLPLAKTFRTELYLRHRDGRDLWINVIGYSFDSSIPVRSAIWMLEDRTAARQAEDMLRASHAALLEQSRELARRELELRAVIENAYDAYVCMDDRGIVTAWNVRAHETFGWSPSEAIGSELERLIIPRESVRAYRAWCRRYLHEQHARVVEKRMELTVNRRDGSRLMVEASLRSLNFEGRTIISGFLHDITERKLAEQRREREAGEDALTGLANRRGLMDRLSAAMLRADRSGGMVCLIFIDLDGFKAVNDRCGHEAGDLLLKRVAHVLQASVRGGDLVVRLGGDEFVVLVEDLHAGPHEAQVRAGLILEAICSVSPEDDTLRISASIGVAIRAPGGATSASELVRRADKAMYQAKHGGKSRVVLAEDDGRDLLPEI